MKSRHAAIAAVVLAGLVAIWFIFLRGEGDGEARPKAAAAGPGSAASAAPAPQRPPDRSGDLDTRVLVDDDPAGVLRLEGLVLDADDGPVAGATVVLSANPPRTTRTEDDGSFAFDKLVARPYTLTARAPGGVGGPITAKLTAASDPVVLRLVPGGQVTVHVVDGKQQALAATVELRGIDTQTADARPAAVFAPVVPGRYDVVARAPGFAAGFAMAVVGAAPVEVTVLLAPGAPVEGRVVDGKGAPVGDALVIYSAASDWNIRPDERRDGVRSAADGSFRFEALPAGTFRFVARHDAHAPGSSALVTLDGVTATAGVKIELSPGATVSGKVVDNAGKPVASARVRIGVATRNMIGGEPRQVFAGDDGTFTVTGLPRKPLEAVALADRGSSATVAVDTTAGDVSGLSLTLDVTGTIAGVVVDKTGEPLEGMQVSAFPDFRSGTFDPSSFRLRGFPQELTDAGGRFELVGLAPGAYMVRAARSVAGRGRTFGMDGERAETGTRDLRIVLPADGGVKGKVALADGTVPTPFSVAVGFAPELINSKDGSFTLRELPPRKYQLTVRGVTIDQRSVEVEVKEGEIADVGTIVVGKGRSIAGTVRMNGAPIAGATVLAGRQLFGTGSSGTAQAGMGPPGRQNNREATTDAEGRFTISGLGPADLALVAEHPDVGRSAAILLQRGAGDEQALAIELAPFGQLAGKVTDGDGPAADTIVSAQSVTAPNAMYSVSTGADGTYRFDRLAPDLYKVSAMLGSPMRGMAFHSTQVTVLSGQVAHADLTVEKGVVALEVKAIAAGDGEFRGGFAWLIRGVIAAKNGRELSARVARLPGGMASFSVMFGGRPATFEELVPGGYTVCLSALPTQAAGPQAMAYLERHGDELPTACRPATVAEAPAKQTLEVTVEIPPYIAD